MRSSTTAAFRGDPVAIAAALRDGADLDIPTIKAFYPEDSPLPAATTPRELLHKALLLEALRLDSRPIRRAEWESLAEALGTDLPTWLEKVQPSSKRVNFVGTWRADHAEFTGLAGTTFAGPDDPLILELGKDKSFELRSQIESLYDAAGAYKRQKGKLQLRFTDSEATGQVWTLALKHGATGPELLLHAHLKATDEWLTCRFLR